MTSPRRSAPIRVLVSMERADFDVLLNAAARAGQDIEAHLEDCLRTAANIERLTPLLRRKPANDPFGGLPFQGTPLRSRDRDPAGPKP